MTRCCATSTVQVADEFEEEEDLTVEELRQRPCGKTPGGRSLLHDDMTVIVIDFVDLKGLEKRAKALQMDMPPSPAPTPMRAKSVIVPSAASAIQPGVSTPFLQRRGTKIANRPMPRHGSVLLSLSRAPPEVEGGAQIPEALPELSLDGGEGQGTGKARGQPKGIKSKRRVSATGALADIEAMAAGRKAVEADK